MTLPTMPPAPELSVVIASRNEGDRLRQTVDAFLATLPADSEIVVVDDASGDGSADFLRGGYEGVVLADGTRSRGGSGARNFGAEHARGGYLVFSDAHVEPPPGWADAICSAAEGDTVGLVGAGICSIEHHEQVGFGHRWDDDLRWRWEPQRSDVPYAVPFIGAAFVAMRRDVFRDVGGFDHGLMVWGSIGDELCLRLWLLGYQCVIVPSVVVPHLFRPKHPYDVNWAAVVHNQLRMAMLHFSEARFARLVNRLAGKHGFLDGMAHLIGGDAWALRERYRKLRVRDDNWFFDKFGMDVLEA